MNRSELLYELLPFFRQWAADAQLGQNVLEGPGIDLIESGADRTVGLGGDSVLLYRVDGSPVAEFDTISAALSAASRGCTILLPSKAFDENVVMIAGVTIRGMGLGSVIHGTVTGAEDACLKDVYVDLTADSPNPLYGVKGAGVKFRVLNTYVYVENATGPARAVAAVSGGETRCQNVRVAAVGGEEGYGFYQDVGDLYTDHCIARASDCTTAPLRRRG